jgi:CheY-like chemotaxis protein
VLWVENHDGFVRVAGKQFLSAHELIVTPSVSRAVAALASQTFDVVLVDYDLDDGKGSQVVEFARQLPARPPVVAVSSHADGNSSLLAAGAVAACPKAKFASIESVIRSVVASAQRRAEPSAAPDPTT